MSRHVTDTARDLGKTFPRLSTMPRRSLTTGHTRQQVFRCCASMAGASPTTNGLQPHGSLASCIPPVKNQSNQQGNLWLQVHTALLRLAAIPSVTPTIKIRAIPICLTSAEKHKGPNPSGQLCLLPESMISTFISHATRSNWLRLQATVEDCNGPCFRVFP